MNAPDITFAANTIPSTIGAAFEGGFYAGRIRVDDALFALVVSPAAGDLAASPLTSGRKKVSGALSYFDGYVNTNALALAGVKIAEAVLELNIAGFADWYLPSRDELELLYRHFKPTTYETWAWRNGDNPSSVPAGYPYTKDHGQTALASFREGGADALQDGWYWSSTLSAPDAAAAWAQGFHDGHQDYYPRYHEFRARAVRRVAIR